MVEKHSRPCDVRAGATIATADGPCIVHHGEAPLSEAPTTSRGNRRGLDAREGAAPSETATERLRSARLDDARAREASAQGACREHRGHVPSVASGQSHHSHFAPSSSAIGLTMLASGQGDVEHLARARKGLTGSGRAWKRPGACPLDPIRFARAVIGARPLRLRDGERFRPRGSCSFGPEVRACRSSWVARCRGTR